MYYFNYGLIRVTHVVKRENNDNTKYLLLDKADAKPVAYIIMIVVAHFKSIRQPHCHTPTLID